MKLPRINKGMFPKINLNLNSEEQILNIPLFGQKIKLRKRAKIQMLVLFHFSLLWFKIEAGDEEEDLAIKNLLSKAKMRWNIFRGLSKRNVENIANCCLD